MAKLLGIYREVQHSPNRESDDALILRETGKRLAENGFDVEVKSPEEISRETFQGSGKPQLVFMMCEREEILSLLQSQSLEDVTIVNSPESILNTYRYRMIPMLKSAKIPMPKTELFPTDRTNFGAISNVWVKRGDVHNTQKGDVFLAKTHEEIQKAFANFKSRGVSQAALQDHIEGDLIKFYGVGEGQGEGVSGTPWFKWFYHKGQELKEYRFSRERLKAIVFQAAAQLKLEVFGGDAIVDPKGDIFLIDLNAWPSFALFREEASHAIADYLASALPSFKAASR